MAVSKFLVISRGYVEKKQYQNIVSE